MNVHWFSWALMAFVVVGIGWGLAVARARNRSLRKVSRPTGGYEYVWLDPFGREHRSRTHPALADGAASCVGGGSGDYGGDGGCGGGGGD